MRFIVAVEGVSYEFASFELARAEFDCMRSVGFPEATLRAVDDNGNILRWNASVGAFFPA